MALGPIAILGGTGQQGSGLARRLAAAGVQVIVGSRDPQRARATVDAWSPPVRVDVAENAAAAASAETILLAVPYATIDALLEEITPHLTPDAVAIDLIVPLTFAGGKMAMLDVPEGSAAEHIRARLPPTVALACAFKTIPAHLVHRADEPLDCDEFICGDSDSARGRAAELRAQIAGRPPPH